MSLDLSAAVDAAARDHYDRERVNLLTGERDGPEWDDVSPHNKSAWREHALPYVAAAAPVIEAAVRAQATRLEPWESIALTVASAQLDRGEEPGPNTAAVCIGALERLVRGESS